MVWAIAIYSLYTTMNILHIIDIFELQFHFEDGMQLR